jgi:hypothetical protein
MFGQAAGLVVHVQMRQFLFQKAGVRKAQPEAIQPKVGHLSFFVGDA